MHVETLNIFTAATATATATATSSRRHWNSATCYFLDNTICPLILVRNDKKHVSFSSKNIACHQQKVIKKHCSSSTESHQKTLSSTESSKNIACHQQEKSSKNIDCHQKTLTVINRKIHQKTLLVINRKIHKSYSWLAF
jgi:hypothetical protein